MICIPLLDPLPDAATICGPEVAPAVATEPPGNDADAWTERAEEDPAAAAIGGGRVGALTVGAEPPGDDTDAALTDGEERSLEANLGYGQKPAPQPKSGCELVSTRKNQGVQPSVPHGVPNWLNESNED